MHELSIALSLVEGVLEQTEKQGGLKVEAVHLKLGVLSGVDKDALSFSYTVAIEGTPLAQSRLVIEEVPLTIHCPSCGGERTLAAMEDFSCPICKTPAQDIVRGREIEITGLEVAA